MPAKWTTITDRLCGPHEAAEILGLTNSMAKTMCQTGALDAVKIGERAWVIDRLSVERLRASRLTSQ